MNKPFDAVAWMRKRRAEIEEQDSGLTWEERTQKTMERLRDDPLWRRLKDRVASPTRTPLASSVTE
jgi:hypothetical protein